MKFPQRRAASAVAATVTVAVAVSGCQAKTGADRQFDAARLRAATALTKLSADLDALAAERIARSTVVSTSTPRAVSDLADLDPLGDGRQGWRVVVEVLVEDDGGLFAGSSTETRCYAFEVDAEAGRTAELPSDEVPCDEVG